MCPERRFTNYRINFVLYANFNFMKLSGLHRSNAPGRACDMRFSYLVMLRGTGGHKHRGYLFQDRHRFNLVDEGLYLRHFIRYVHYNLVETAGDYR